MDKISAVLNRFPQHAYDGENISTTSVLYNVIKSIIDEFNITMNNIDRINKMIGIDNTLPEDIYNRFGALLNIKQNPGETDEQYRSRLKVSVTALSGGTAEAIKYAIASVIGIATNEDAINEYIKVYDAWKYPYEFDPGVITDTSYGNIICTIDLQANEGAMMMYNRVMDTINTTKASGIYPYLLFIYNSSESATLEYVEEDSINNISTDTSDTTSVVADIDGYDRIILTPIDEGTTLVRSSVWSFIGTNTDFAVLNDGFVTNMFMEVDECSDVVIYGVTIIGKAIIGASAIGTMPF